VRTRPRLPSRNSEEDSDQGSGIKASAEAREGWPEQAMLGPL